MNRPVFVAGPASRNMIVDLDRLPEPRPHTVFARREHETLGGTSAGKALHLVDLGADVVLHTVVGRDPTAEVIRSALTVAGVPVSAWAGEGRSERHLNLMTAAGERLSIYLSGPRLTTATEPGVLASPTNPIDGDSHFRLWPSAPKGVFAVLVLTRGGPHGTVTRLQGRSADQRVSDSPFREALTASTDH